jgi:hypothetical protein
MMLDSIIILLNKIKLCYSKLFKPTSTFAKIDIFIQ